MTTTRIPNIDADGNFTNPDVLARLAERFGGSSGSQLTATEATTTAQVNTWLATPSPLGVKRLAGALAITTALVLPTSTYLDATGSTITLAPGSDTNLLRNTAVTATTTRDKNITVVGGRWVRGTNAGTGTGAHSLIFRRVDGLRVQGVTVDTDAGKYAINLGDVTDFRVIDPYFADCASDGVHINGPASNGRVTGVRGVTHDDSVAITGNDYAAYADVFGSVTNVKILDVDTTSGAANNVKVLAGQGCTVDDITVAGVRGKHYQNAVWLGDDNGQPVTDNGTQGRLIVRDVDTEGGQTSSAHVYGNFGTGAREVIVEDVALRRGLGTYVVLIGADATVDTLRIIRPTVDGLAGRRVLRFQGPAAARINRLDITSPTMRVVGGNGMVLDTSNNLGTVNLTDVQLTADDTATTKWVNLGGGTSDAVTIAGGRITGGRSVCELVVGGNFLLTGGLSITGAGRVSNVYGGTPVFTFGDCVIVSTANALFMLNTGAVGIVVQGGENTTFPATPNLLQRNATQTYRVNGRKLRAPLTELTPVSADMATAQAAVGTIPAGHPVVYTGTVWKSLIDGTTSA